MQSCSLFSWKRQIVYFFHLPSVEIVHFVRNCMDIIICFRTLYYFKNSSAVCKGADIGVGVSNTLQPNHKFKKPEILKIFEAKCWHLNFFTCITTVMAKIRPIWRSEWYYILHIWVLYFINNNSIALYIICLFIKLTNLIH